MRFPHVFIDRPILASVLSLAILLIGAVSYFSLPVAQYPEVAPPTIIVTASFPGADAETVAKTVATPIEQEVNGVEGMLYMYSQSSTDGQMQLTITFRPGTDVDTAQVLVQNRVSVAAPRLPAEVRNIGVTTQKNTPDILMVVHMMATSAAHDQLFLSNYAILQVRDALARIEGVGGITVVGAREYAMRVWLDPRRLSSLDLTASDVVSALREQNVEVAGGALGRQPMSGDIAFEIPLRVRGRLETPEEFSRIIVKTGEDGRFTRLGDVARVELGARDYVTTGYLNGEVALPLLIQQLPGSNALATANAVKAEMERLARNFPEGIAYRIVYNPTEFIEQSIDELIKTIFEASLLVVLVIIVFLHSWRASLIPILTIPVSLVGTFAAMTAFGFSINNLTLFGLVLAVGIVVDDAIVVVENVERNMREGLDAREAARRTMVEVGGALIGIGLVLTAVFVPAAFVSGISGQFYRQFSLTIVTATIISVVNSLTLSPALAALLFQGHGEKDKTEKDKIRGLFERFAAGFERMFEALSGVYAALVARLVGRAPLMALVYVGLIALTAFAFLRTPTGFIPAQDQGYLITSIQLPEGASLSRTDRVVERVQKELLAIPGIANTAAFAGFSGATRTNMSNAGAVFAVLAPFEERARTGRDVHTLLAEVRKRLSAIKEANVFVFPPPPVRGLGTAGGFRMMVEDRGGRGTATLEQAARDLIDAARAEPGLASIFTSFNTGTPQLFIDIDRTKAEMLKLPVGNIFSTIETYMGSTYVNDFNLLGRTYRVTAQADGPFRDALSDLRDLRARSDAGVLVPLGTVAEFRTITGPSRFPRYNLFPAIEIDGDTLPGYSSGQSLEKMERLAAGILPEGIGFDWTDLAYQEVNEGDTALFIFPLAVAFVFLALAALYESWSLPLAIVLIVPMCLLSAIGGVILRGMDNNILTQIGFIVLVGLACKNAILIVEFARQAEERGRDRFEAAIEACRLRLRPILMTSIAFIMGVVPLLIASGAGAEMRQALGTAVFFGMLGVTGFGLLFTPIFYVLIRGILPGRRIRAP
ncbi:MAG: multidrug efflux RND transporter permease subunit [Rhodothalassiaceae bacterium]